jgi:hypothetical protein
MSQIVLVGQPSRAKKLWHCELEVIQPAVRPSNMCNVSGCIAHCRISKTFYILGPHGQFRQNFHHPRKSCHDFSLATGGARLRAPAPLYTQFSWHLLRGWWTF